MGGGEPYLKKPIIFVAQHIDLTFLQKTLN